MKSNKAKVAKATALMRARRGVTSVTFVSAVEYAASREVVREAVHDGAGLVFVMAVHAALVEAWGTAGCCPFPMKHDDLARLAGCGVTSVKAALSSLRRCGAISATTPTFCEPSTFTLHFWKGIASRGAACSSPGGDPKTAIASRESRVPPANPEPQTAAVTANRNSDNSDTPTRVRAREDTLPAPASKNDVDEKWGPVLREIEAALEDPEHVERDRMAVVIAKARSLPSAAVETMSAENKRRLSQFRARYSRLVLDEVLKKNGK